MNWNRERKLISRVGFSIFVTLAVLMLLFQAASISIRSSLRGPELDRLDA